MTTFTVPPVIRAVGLACVPVASMQTGETALARRPVAAALVTLALDADGRRTVAATRMSDARDTEFPLPWLLSEALAELAPTIVSAGDRATLAIDAAARRFWAEPALAALCRGDTAIEPTGLADALIDDEDALCRRWGIPLGSPSADEVERVWSRHATEAAERLALGAAVARLMLWAHRTAFDAAEPDAFFETVLPLREWSDTQAEDAPAVHAAGLSRPVMRAVSFSADYRRYRAEREAGRDATWMQFEDGLFHV